VILEELLAIKWTMKDWLEMGYWRLPLVKF